ncbi:chromodomain-helicase-DNA-binding protein 1 [Monoraphidium neglectum]|uniref:Chromodomain-helicase-DNA-binding protein 1 n=1 Tax=Monoraphidium neglectum TaxID=145388 RepID=A0A0D2LYE7_9CHLO|nr:chromodomain-helicase-DNA-binding protein 1 [Monoraphidium neglectum]KIY94476.1 chromodomain-helicase-DNA-binding protein 1 [Monoraphidium neglectum]|eukprot:XP_013893496.1 chromodomain-helicase-DNA-binding protein 1 [Monoraphidium neglectum]
MALARWQHIACRRPLPPVRQVERVVAEREACATRYLVKWEGLPYAECTWEAEEDVVAATGGGAAVGAFARRQQRLLEPSQGIDAQRAAFRASKQMTEALREQPAFLAGGQLRDYQLVGVSWMAYAWVNDRNGILADEMGLGKTVQCVSMLGVLSETVGHRGPFLVVVPLSVVPNWLREFKKWTPEASVVVYVGDSRSREVIRTFEFPMDQGGSGVAGVRRQRSGGKSREFRFEVLITTYELVLKDAGMLGSIRWSYLMVDEAHRLKNSESALYQELATWSFRNKLLVTGTPLQNNMRELWALLHFLEPEQFPDCESFEEQYNTKDADKVTQLHAALRPHLIRRAVKDVERSLPPKTERILRVGMSPLQRRYYKWILTRNFKELNKGQARVSLLNVLIELKKCCNHPFLFESAEENYRGDEHDKTAVDRLIVTSGKMVLLDKLMVRVLDIISDYMRLRGLPHQRLDGSTPAAQRHTAMEHFNAPGSPDFAFLLSTRAGGLGINLATADT